jgi:hypothetical protein
MEIGQYEPTKQKSLTIMPSKIGMKYWDELACIAVTVVSKRTVQTLCFLYLNFQLN